jgi:NAD(P)H-dependent FMN reductase
MQKRCKILGMAGSPQRVAYNRAALRAAVRLAPETAIIERPTSALRRAGQRHG